MFCMPRALLAQASAGLAVACASGWFVVMADCGVMSHSLPFLHMLKLVVTDISVGLDFSRRLGPRYHLMGMWVTRSRPGESDRRIMPHMTATGIPVNLTAVISTAY
jgi:hypothetical protein